MAERMKVSALNNAAIEQFREFISKTRDSENTSGKQLQPPSYLISDPDCLSKKKYNAGVDLSLVFADRYEFGKYLVESFGDDFDDEYYHDSGLWAWLALAYFEQLRGKKFRTRNGRRSATQKVEHFVPHEWLKATGRSLGYRHSVRTAFRFYREFGDNARFYTSKRGMESFGDMAEQTASDSRIMSSPVLRQLMMDLYQNEDGYAKTGTLAIRPSSSAKARRSSKAFGKLRRLMDDYLPRVQLTYDVNVMKPDEIRKLCGDEFT